MWAVVCHLWLNYQLLLCGRIILHNYKAPTFPYSVKIMFGEVPHPWNAGVIDVPVRGVLSGWNSRRRQSAVQVAHSRRRAGWPPAPVATNQSLAL